MSQILNVWPDLIRLAGIMQLGVALGSLAVPYLLQWRSELSNVRLLTRQIFWTYAAYIFCTNLFFSVLSIFLAPKLADGTELSIAVNLFIALYWGARLGIQFFYFDKKGLPSSGIYRYGEWALTLCFAYFTLVFGGAALIGARGLP
ncbi:hypothetical protein [Cohnella terricola]|uniref:Uncharacterized protein n=1 Tax=Cohnella terricola TaxID=1289167 RepID=A0A559JWC1_9BACL|nr:hypothetical protein [Cohnella terricola]TVY04183.1 hypothetical protein FPZ45_00855 [Cohnella terricola]